MRIGFEAKRAFSNFTGLGNYSRSTIEQLAEFFPSNEYFLYTTPYKPNDVHSFACRNNIKIVKPKGLAALIPSIWRSFGIGSDAKRDGVELFHGLSGEIPSGLSRKGIKSVVTIHDLIFLRYPEFYKAIDRKIYLKKFTKSAHEADLVIAISEQTKQDCVSFLGIDESKVKVVYQGCSGIYNQAATDEEKVNVAKQHNLPKRYLLYVGTVEERKNLLTVVKALPLIPNDIELVVVGRRAAPYADKVKSAISELGVENRVKFLRNIPSTSLPALYQMALAFTYPSIFEGFGIPILEALCSKIPVITTNVSCLPEAAGPDSLYIDPYDHQMLANHVCNLAESASYRTEVVEKSHLHTLSFTPEKIANNIYATYQELLNR